MKQTIGFYGIGNMSQAIIKGLLRSRLYKANQIYVYNRCYEPNLKNAEEELGIIPILNQKELLKKATTLVIAVKPFVVPILLENISSIVGSDYLIVSLAAGISLKHMETYLGEKKDMPRLIRVMPNISSMIGYGMASICGNKIVTKEDLEHICHIFQSLGKVEIISERLINSVIATSGSGPAYVYVFIQALIDGAVSEGMPYKKAFHFATQTVLGATKMVLETNKSITELKNMVCSPGGITIEALKSLEKNNFYSSIVEAIKVAARKNHEMEKNRT